MFDIIDRILVGVALLMVALSCGVHAMFVIHLIKKTK